MKNKWGEGFCAYIKEKCLCDRCLKETEEGQVCRYCGFDADAYEEPSHVLPVNTVLIGKYQIGCTIGEGGFGITYAGWDLVLDKPVAVKEFFPKARVSRDSSSTFCVTPDDTEDNQLIYYKGVKWFEREARILAALEGTPNIVNVKDYFQANGTAYIIMDFIRGKSLMAYAIEKGGVLAAEEVLSLMKKPLMALSKVHQYGLLHRDISPANLMIDEDGEVYLIDFGAATTLDINSELRATELFIHNGFAPPEQYLEKEQGTWSDIYSVCSTMVCLIQLLV